MSTTANDKNGVKDTKIRKKNTNEHGTPIGDNPLKQFYTSQPRFVGHITKICRSAMIVWLKICFDVIYVCVILLLLMTKVMFESVI